MKITIRQLKQLIKEQVEEAGREADEDLVTLAHGNESARRRKMIDAEQEWDKVRNRAGDSVEASMESDDLDELKYLKARIEHLERQVKRLNSEATGEDR